MRGLFALVLLIPAAAAAQDADVTTLRAQLRAAQDQIAADKVEIGQLQAGSGASAQDLAAVQQQNVQLQQNFKGLQAAANNLIKSIETRDKAASDAIAAQTTACQAQNQKLAATAEDILHLYQTQSFRSILLGSYEPILGLDRVKLENIVQDYDDKIYAHRVAQPDPGASQP
jgi:chromosome segregation ATPase